jgi:sulfite reductase (ferredoxin)
MYAGFVNGAKAILLAEKRKQTTTGIINLFDVVFVESNKITLILPLKIYSNNQNEPSEAFAKKYIEEAIAFFKT